MYWRLPHPTQCRSFWRRSSQPIIWLLLTNKTLLNPIVLKTLRGILCDDECSPRLFLFETDANVLWMRNCSAYSKPYILMVLHYSASTAGQPADTADIVADFLKVCRPIRSLTLTLNAYLLEERSCQISRRAVVFFWRVAPNKIKNNKMGSNMGSVPTSMSRK